MGCNGSKAQDISKERARVAAPKSGNPSGPQGGPPTPNVALPRAPTATPAPTQRAMSPRVFGTSLTDRKMREQEEFLTVVQRARQEFIDVAAHPKMGPAKLNAASIARFRKYERMVNSQLLPNKGFFSVELPKSSLSTSSDPEALPNALSLLTSPAVSGQEAGIIADRAIAVSNSVSDVKGPSLTLVITYEQFEKGVLPN